MDDLRTKMADLIHRAREEVNHHVMDYYYVEQILALEPLARLLAADKAANDFNERHA